LNENSWYGKFIATLDADYTRYSAKFDSNLNLISIYDSISKVEITDLVEKKQAAGKLLFLITYFGQVTHAVIHIFHLMLGTGIYASTKHDPSMSTWAAPYATNLFLKYEEVELYLMHPKIGALTGSIYRSNAKKVLDLGLKEIEAWSSFKTADEFIKGFILSGMDANGIAQFKKIGGLEQYFSHASLINGYATELTEAFKQSDDNSYYYTNTLLQLYFKKIGTIHSVHNLKQWIELISVTGLTHGSTLSTTRLIFNDEIFKQFPKK